MKKKLLVVATVMMLFWIRGTSQSPPLAQVFQDIPIFPTLNNQSEVSISINKTSPQYILVSSNVLVSSTFGMGFYVSKDAGATWAIKSDVLPGDAPQVIFETDTPSISTYVAQGCQYLGINRMNGCVPSGNIGIPLYYSIYYGGSNKNQEYSDISYYFYPDYGIVQKMEYSTPQGDRSWCLFHYHIIQ